MFQLTDDTARYVRLQRTSFINTGTEELRSLFYESCLKDVISFSKYLTESPLFVLDVGSGMGGTDVLLYRKYKSSFHLLDKNFEDSEIQYGFSESPSRYNNFELTRQFMLLNGVPKGKFAFYSHFPPLRMRYNLIMSLISCGFHYPLITYLGQIVKVMAPGCVCVFDVRKDTGQFELLHQTFNYVDTVQVHRKYKRVVCR